MQQRLPFLAARLGSLGKRGGGGVVERAQHPGDVAQRRAEPAPLGQGTVGLALEVEDHPSLIDAHHLAEVVVAMDADGQATALQ